SVLRPRPEISGSVKPVIFESVMLIVALVALNQPGNFSDAPFLIVNRLFAPETVKANFRKGEIESVWVVTIEWSRTSSPPAFTFSAYPWWDVSFAKLRPPSVSVRLPPEFTLIVPSTEYRIPVQTCVFVIVQSPVMTPPTWSQVPARAAGARARSVANSPPRATDQTMRSVRALALRPATIPDGRNGTELDPRETGSIDLRPVRWLGSDREGRNPRVPRDSHAITGW